MDVKKGMPLGFMIRNLAKQLRRRADSCAGKQYLESLTGTNGWIIGFLAHNSGRDVFQKDIEETFSVRRSTVSRVVTLMEQKGLINRHGVDSDARLKKLVLTDKAVEIHRTIETELLDLESTLVEGLSDEDIDNFRRIAFKMLDNLSDGCCQCHKGSYDK